MADGIREVRLPSDLCQAAEQRYGARFGSLEQFLEFVLQNYCRKTRLKWTRPSNGSSRRG